MTKHIQNTKVILIGDLCLDIFFQVPNYPQPGGDGLAQKMVTQLGGSAANTAVALAHLGIEPHLLTHAGSDLWGERTLGILRQEGVATGRIIQEAGESTGVTFLAVTPDGERTMFTYRGANTHLHPDEITSEALNGASLLHLSGYACLTRPQSDAVWKAVDLAAAAGMDVTLDIGVEPAYALGKALINMLPKLSLLILGEPEANAIAKTEDLEKAIRFLLDHGVKMVGLKLGKYGCQLITAARRASIPGFEMPVVDTTGAGDAFSAGMIYGLCKGLSHEAAGLLANTMGGLAVTNWGAGSALPDAARVVEFLEKNQNHSPQNKPWIDEVLASLSC